MAEAKRYYALLRIVDDLTAVEDEFLKVALYDFGPVERTTAPPSRRSRRATRSSSRASTGWTS